MSASAMQGGHNQVYFTLIWAGTWQYDAQTMKIGKFLQHRTISRQNYVKSGFVYHSFRCVQMKAKILRLTRHVYTYHI